ncbi:DUF1127 domain-containing protein [Sulfitobacter sp. S190]|nr:DUF1127 domain-containing protein [Sulfitobacter sp. S190]
MPARAQTTAPAPFLTATAVLSQIGAVLRAINVALMHASTSSARVRQIEALQSKSDAELADIGIKRDEIVHHVFRDLYYV